MTPNGGANAPIKDPPMYVADAICATVNQSLKLLETSPPLEQSGVVYDESGMKTEKLR